MGPGLGTEGPSLALGASTAVGTSGDQARGHLCHFAPPRSKHDALPPAGRSPQGQMKQDQMRGRPWRHSQRDVPELPKRARRLVEMSWENLKLKKVNQKARWDGE